MKISRDSSALPSFYEKYASLALVLSTLAVWELFARAGWISVMFFPPPSKIITNLISMITSGKLFPNLGMTLFRLLMGCLIGGVPGLILGLAMGWSPRIRRIFDPIIAALHPLPKIAIFPLIMIIFGLGNASKIAAIAIATFFPLLINSMAGVRQINPVYFEVTNNFGASLRKTFTRVVVPGSLPMILTGVRLAINVALLITIAVEWVSSKTGLGVLVWFAWQTLRIEELYASLVVIGLLGFLINFGLQLLTAHLAPWQKENLTKTYG